MWNYETDTGVMYHISKNFEFNETVAIFSLHNTLIKSVLSKDKIPFMQLFDNGVIEFLQNIHNGGGSLIIMDDMQGVPQYIIKDGIKRFYELLDNATLELPFFVMFSTINNRYRKPYTHIFDKLKSIYGSRSEIRIDVEQSILVGNNAGRIKTMTFGGDLVTDRAFAHNIGIANFITPQVAFSGDNIQRNWKWNPSIIGDFTIKHKTLVEMPMESIFENTGNNRVIFVTGPPTSGKTLLANRIREYLVGLNPNKSVDIFDINNYESMRQMVAVIRKDIDSQIKNKISKDIVIVHPMELNYIRNMYFSIFEPIPVAVMKHYHIKYIEVDIERPLAEFLNMFRMQISRSNTLKPHSKYDYNTYYYRYDKFDILKITLKKIIPALKYIRYRFVIREKPEMFYKY
jgi:hypothetical protein